MTVSYIPYIPEVHAVLINLRIILANIATCSFQYIEVAAFDTYTSIVLLDNIGIAA